MNIQGLKIKLDLILSPEKLQTDKLPNWDGKHMGQTNSSGVTNIRAKTVSVMLGQQRLCLGSSYTLSLPRGCSDVEHNY